MHATIKHLVFDMGGVLVDIDWHGKVSKLLGKKIPFHEIHALWAESASTSDFEHGRIDFDTFTDAFIAEHQLRLSKTQFQQDFMDIIIGDFPGVVELLAELQQQFTISLLSNTNVAHWEYIVARNTFLPYVDNPFTSLQFGLMKPSAAIYQRLISELACEPEEILFFDDGRMNVMAAREQGMHAEQVFGPKDIKRVLLDYGLVANYSNG